MHVLQHVPYMSYTRAVRLFVLQAGTNKCASQSGMAMGGVRHIADIKADDLTREGTGIIGLQSGSNKGASQKGAHAQYVCFLSFVLHTVTSRFVCRNGHRSGAARVRHPRRRHEQGWAECDWTAGRKQQRGQPGRNEYRRSQASALKTQRTHICSNEM